MEIRILIYLELCPYFVTTDLKNKMHLCVK